MLLHILFISPSQLFTDTAVPTKNHNVIIDSKYKSPQLKMENSLFTLSPEILTHIDKIVEVPHDIEDTIKAIQNLGNELKHGRDTFLVFFTDELKKHTERKYFVSSDKEMAKRVCGFFPALYAYNAYDKIEYKLPLTDTAAEIATSPLFDELTSELLVKFDETKLPKFYLFYDKIEQLEGFRDVVYKHRNDVKIGHLEFKKEGSLKHVGINDTDMPAIVTIVEGAKYSEKLLDAQKLDDFLTSFVNKTIKPFELSEDVIEDSDEVLKQNKISRKMYKTGDYKHSLLFFVSKNCGHCKNLKPVIKELIKENRSKVKVCVVDATKNDFSEFVIRGYPTIAYAEDGNIKYFEGERSVAKFVDFVKKNSKDGIDMLSEEEGHADL